MAFVSDIRSSGFNAGNTLIARFADLRGALAARLEQHRTFRRTFNELSKLSNRELADLGIHRSNIHAIATQAVYK